MKPTLRELTLCLISGLVVIKDENGQIIWSLLTQPALLCFVERCVQFQQFTWTSTHPSLAFVVKEVVHLSCALGYDAI